MRWFRVLLLVVGTIVLVAQWVWILESQAMYRTFFTPFEMMVGTWLTTVTVVAGWWFAIPHLRRH